jgi:FkbM family methyltransferase
MMRLGGRSLHTITRAPFQPRHYRAALNMARVYHHPLPVLYRYLSGAGKYPWDVPVRTPLGTVTPRVFSHAALRTLNEIFCRLDYRVDDSPKVIVDIGSNVGLSALYFLTRNMQSLCYLFEPLTENVSRLEQNLAAFRGRYILDTNAVADTDGMVEFGVESTGQYGGIGVRTGRSIQVRCRSINAVLEDVLRKESKIDLVKIDTEGAEERTILAMNPRYLDRIGALYAEARPGRALLSGRFSQEQDGEVVRLYNLTW